MRVVCSKCDHVRERPLEQPSGAATMPSEGDFWVCPECGELHRFTGRWVVSNHTMTISELFVRPAGLAELEQLEPELRRLLLEQRTTIIARRGTA